MSDDSFSWLQSDQIYVGRRRRGVNVTELLDLPEAQRELVVEITRREPVGLRELTEALDRDPVELEVQVSQMVAQGWLDVEENEDGGWVYRVRIARRVKRVLPPGIWQVLDSHWQVPIFRLFPEAIREKFSDVFELQRHKAGTILFEAGDWGERMYIVEQGKVELVVHNEADRPFVLREVNAGGIFGEMAVLLGERRPYAAHVMQETQVWALDKNALDALLAQHPTVGLAVRQQLARHLKAPSKAAEAKSQYNPIIAVGDGGGALARHLAEQTGSKIVLIDIVGRKPDGAAQLAYIDAHGMRSKVLAQTIQDEVQHGAWVIVAAMPKMSDQLMRVANVAEVVLDLTGSGAPWLRAAARRYWVVPSSTPLQMARLARRLCGSVTGMVLSGGMARSLAHLGVLDVLHQEGISIDLFASCGYAALWSVLYAAEWSPEQIIDWVTREASRLGPFGNRLGLRAASRPGLFDARATRNLIQNTLEGMSFADLETPCYLALSDLDTGEVVCIDEGPLFNALSACVATPGLVTPIDHQGRLLVDAILTNPLPADAALTGGADIILASSVIPVPSARQEHASQPSRARDLVSSWLNLSEAIAHERSLQHLNAIDILIAPDVSEFSDQAFDQVERLIDRGRQAAQEVLPRIRSLMQQEE
jgi:NTE family protein